jgi:tetratricopeptide (TPR) repeat protein
MPHLRLLIAAALILPAAAQTPPEAKAYSEAAREKDPEKKVALLDQLLKQYPDARVARNALGQLAAAAVQAWPKDRQRLVALIDKQAGLAKSGNAAALFAAFASELSRANLYPDLALLNAKKAVKLGERAAYETLGDVELKAGRTGRAEAAFRKALRLDPTRVNSAKSLAVIYEKKAQSQRALTCLAHAFLARPVADNRKAFGEAWKKAHGGTMDGADVYLDALYRKVFPPPVRVARSRRPAARTVMVEVHTGAGCPPCVSADLAFDAVMERHSRQEVVVAMFHQHIPRPDPLTNPDTQARWKAIEGRGVPTYIIDGSRDGGGGSRSQTGSAYNRIEPKIEKRLATPAGAALALRASRDGKLVKAAATVSRISKPSDDLKLSLALVEKQVRYSGENGIRFHPMVVRDLEAFDVKEGGAVEHSFDVDKVEAALKAHIDAFEKKDGRHNPDGKFRFAEYRHAVDAGNLAVVAFVEDRKSKEVLQAAYFDLTPSPGKRGK